jgi:hypothetical protein
MVGTTHRPSLGHTGRGARKAAAGNGHDDTGMSPRLRVVISCVTHETVKITKPVEDLRAEKAYLICWDGGGRNENCTVFNEFYEDIVSRLHAMGFGKGDIVIRRVDVYQFKKVMGELLSIISKERGLGNDIFVNLSAGTMEYVAAATIVSNLFEGVKPFIVHSRLSHEYVAQLAEMYHSKNINVGKTSEVTDPVELPAFHINPPPRDLVAALRILKRRKEKGQSTKYAAMINELKEAGAWTYDEERLEKLKASDSGQERLAQAEKMYYSRHYIDGWMKRGWVDGRNGRGKELAITASGENIAEIFYLDK